MSESNGIDGILLHEQQCEQGIYKVGDHVLIRDLNGRCSTWFKVGCMTGINSQQLMVVDGTPCQVKDYGSRLQSRAIYANKWDHLWRKCEADHPRQSHPITICLKTYYPQMSRLYHMIPMSTTVRNPAQKCIAITEMTKLLLFLVEVRQNHHLMMNYLQINRFCQAIPPITCRDHQNDQANPVPLRWNMHQKWPLSGYTFCDLEIKEGYSEVGLRAQDLLNT